MKRIFSTSLVVVASTFAGAAHAQDMSTHAPQTLPAVGEWDGKTAEAKLDGPYEDMRQTPPPFGVMSYFNQPWRAYMDTWPASKWLGFPGVGFNGDEKYHEAMLQLMSECGIRYARVEVGWNNIGWDEHINQGARENLTRQMKLFRKYGIRPVILLNANHGVPGPIKGFEAELVQDAKKGDRTVHFKPGTTLREGYSGFQNLTDYVAAYPLITKMEEDGTATLSAPLPKELAKGKVQLQELKYQPFQGAKLKDGTDVPQSAETVAGWLNYASEVGDLMRETLATPTDSGFDIEVWNELTFGSNFLDINNYYEPKREYAEPLTYRKTRAWTTALRPDARLQFEDKGYTSLLPMTVDYFNDAKNRFKGVSVISGFSNQWPWGSGSSMWGGQGGLSKHYYTGTSIREASPEKPFGKPQDGTIDALGHLDGRHDTKGSEWFHIVPGTNFVPRIQAAFPEWSHAGFKTETIQRDLFPDSRLTNTPDRMGRYGRYVHNGDFKPPRFWQTEVNYDRADFINRVKKESGASNDDARLIALNDATNSKHMWRQYVFHNHKGFDRVFLFALDFDRFSLGLLPTSFFKALDASGGKLSPEVRKTVPAGWSAVRWMTQLMKTGQHLDATRALRVEKLVEHKPRLVFAGDGSAAHPNKWNRDQFAFLPYQLSPQKFAIPYYVVTLDATHSWDTKKNALDPARYNLPDQEFDVSIANIAGKGAKVSAYDPIKGASVPVQVLMSGPTTLSVRLQATDYPRVLVVEEARPGPQIVAPSLVANADGTATLKWKTNISVGAARVSYGRDWPFRDANERKIPLAKNNDYSVRLPSLGSDMMAARIRLTANGLTTEWPRWDEDPVAQIVMPDAKPRASDAPPSIPQAPLAAATPLVAPPGIALPVAQTNAARNYTFKLPRDSALLGDTRDQSIAESISDDQTVVLGLLGWGANAVSLRVRYIVGGARDASSNLPFTSPTDVVNRRAVTLPSGLAATFVEMELAATAHPGTTDLSREYLLVPLAYENRDLVLLEATGTPSAMKAQSKNVEAVFASFQSGAR